VAGLVDAVVASFTRPFTFGADAVTAVPLAAAVVVTLRLFLKRGKTSSPAPAIVEEGRLSRWWLGWMGALAVVTAWELFCLASAPRAAHPTLSVLIDMLDSTRVGKIVAFTSWLALGWLLVTS